MPDRSAIEALESAKTDTAVVWVARECLRLGAEENLWDGLSPQAVPNLSDAEVITTIAGEWAGGFVEFLRDCEPDIVERRAAEVAAFRAEALRVDPPEFPVPPMTSAQPAASAGSIAVGAADRGDQR